MALTFAQIREQVTDLAGQHKEAFGNRQSQIEQLKSLKEVQKKLHKQIHVIQRDVLDKDKLLSDKEAELEKVYEKIKETEKMLSDSEKLRGSLTSGNVDSQTQIAALEIKCRESQELADVGNKKYSDLSEQFSDAEVKLISCEKLAASDDKKIKELHRDIYVLKTKLGHSQSSSSTKSSDYEEVMQKLAKDIAAAEEKAKSCEKESWLKHKQIDKLEDNLALWKNTNLQLENEKARYQVECR